MITMVAFTTERGNPNKIGFNLIYINLKIYFVLGCRGGRQDSSLVGVELPTALKTKKILPYGPDVSHTHTSVGVWSGVFPRRTLCSG